MKPVVVPKVDGVVEPKDEVVPKPIVPVDLAPNKLVPVLLDGVWPKLENAALDEVEGALKADLFWLNKPILYKKTIRINKNINMQSSTKIIEFLLNISCLHYLIRLRWTKCRTESSVLSRIDTETCTSILISIAGCKKWCWSCCYK